MAEDLGTIFETKSVGEGNSGQQKFSSPNLTLGILRFVAVASMAIGLLAGFFGLMGLANARTGDGFLLAVCLGLFVQGFIIFALYNALALIVENLVGIRKSLTQRDKVLGNAEPIPNHSDQEK